MGTLPIELCARCTLDLRAVLLENCQVLIGKFRGIKLFKHFARRHDPYEFGAREALEQLDPSALPDKHLAVFKKHRAKIEGTASAKFDREGPHSEDGRYDGRPVLVVRSDDLTHTG